jgi:hypothetical protein
MDSTLGGGHKVPIVNRRKLAPDKYGCPGRGVILTQADQKFAPPPPPSASIIMSIQSKCIFVLSMVLVAQPIGSLAVVGPMEAVSPVMHNTNQIQNGTYNQEVSNLFKDLSTLSDKVTSDQQGNSTLNPLRNSSVLDAALANASNLAGSTQEGDDNSLIISVITANIIIFVIGFCGNSLVILVILRFTRIETVTDIYILNLAFADLMFLFGLIFLIITMFIDHWIFGNLMCKVGGVRRCEQGFG